MNTNKIQVVENSETIFSLHEITEMSAMLAFLFKREPGNATYDYSRVSIKARTLQIEWKRLKFRKKKQKKMISQYLICLNLEVHKEVTT